MATRWNKSGQRANADSPKIIKIYDINERTAVGKLIAEWGMDHFQLARIDGKWMIMNVLWQSISDEG
ncbi:MAG TPA: nuclear transport factor 2 family protein [Saprospiraceae bacterium]|nr:nuclear transport factor 2 family protein [Saprospiraceae bacterium]